MNNLLFTRIDDRLIHGQVCAAWLKSIPAIQHILVIDDKTSQDPFMQEMFALLVPSHITIEIRSVEAATKILKPETIEKMIETMFTGPKAKFIPLNIEAFRRGMACVQ